MKALTVYKNISQCIQQRLPKKTNLLTVFLTASLAILLNTGCNSSSNNDDTKETVSNQKASQNLQSPSKNIIKLAIPKKTKEVPTEKLGTNENGKGLEKGYSVKHFTINDITETPYPIEQAWKEKPALIIFYRGGWCPYCNAHVRDLTINYQKLSQAGVQPILISVDQPDKAALLSARYNIPFPVLSDPDLKAHAAFNVVLKLDPSTLDIYKSYGITLSDWSGRNHNSISVASVFIVDTQGKVVVSHAPKDYQARPSIEQLLDLIQSNTNQ